MYRSLTMKCAKALVVALTVATILAGGGVWAVTLSSTIGSVQLTNNNITEGVSVKSCTGPDAGRAGPLWIPFPGFQYLRFEVNSLSEGWRCDFEYKGSADGVVHRANVLVWQGVLRSKRADMTEMALINVVPCVDCVWRVQRDGFYRALDTNHQDFKLMAVWH